MSKLSQFMSGGGGGGGFGGLEVAIISEDKMVEPNTAVGINTFSGEVSVTLPANPDVGDRIIFFDAALSWGRNSATVVLNGDPVQFYDGAEDRFMLSDESGSLSLLFVGEQGWVDSSYFETHTFPTWYESVPGSSGHAISVEEFLGGKTFNQVADFEISNIYTVPADGYYIIAAAGSGGSSEGPNKTTIHIGSTLLMSVGLLRNGLVAFKIGSYEDVYRSEDHQHETIIGRNPINLALQGSVLQQKVSKSSEGHVFSALDDGLFFGIPGFYRRGMAHYYSPSDGRVTVRVYPNSASSSLLVFLNAGDVLNISIGAGSGQTNSGRNYYRADHSGRAVIYQLS